MKLLITLGFLLYTGIGYCENFNPIAGEWLLRAGNENDFRFATKILLEEVKTADKTVLVLSYVDSSGHFSMMVPNGYSGEELSFNFDFHGQKFLINLTKDRIDHFSGKALAINDNVWIDNDLTKKEANRTPHLSAQIVNVSEEGIPFEGDPYGSGKNELFFPSNKGPFRGVYITSDLNDDFLVAYNVCEGSNGCYPEYKSISKHKPTTVVDYLSSCGHRVRLMLDSYIITESSPTRIAFISKNKYDNRQSISIFSDE